MFDRRLVSNFDWVLLLTVLLIAGIGIANLYSATASWHSGGTPFYLKQLIWLAGGVLIAQLICLFDYRHLEYFSIPIYCLSLALLVYVLVVGKTTMGANRWINLGFFNLQPGEVVKIAVILLLARTFAKTANPFGYGLFELWKPALWILLPVVLILKEPDLGTALMVIFIAVTMLCIIPVTILNVIRNIRLPAKEFTWAAGWQAFDCCLSDYSFSKRPLLKSLICDLNTRDILYLFFKVNFQDFFFSRIKPDFFFIIFATKVVYLNFIVSRIEICKCK